jgi:Raf kinase inhibitor-like YbhB/YbcL family protein
MRKLLMGMAAVAGLVLAQAAHALELKSNDVTEGGTFTNEQVFNSFGYSGKNISPELHWTKGPEGTLSYALMMYDPDAPTGSGWWHWVVFNIPADKTGLPKGFGSKSATKSAPAVQSRTDFGTSGYGGPAPPPGKVHHYTFTLFALKVKSLPLKKDSSAAMVGFYANQNALATAKLTVLFGK